MCLSAARSCIIDRRPPCVKISTCAGRSSGCEMKTNAAMIGGGLIGRAWAMVFARAGWQVRLFDSVPAQRIAAHDYMAASLAEQQAYGLVDDAARARSEERRGGKEWR